MWRKTLLPTYKTNLIVEFESTKQKWISYINCVLSYHYIITSVILFAFLTWSWMIHKNLKKKVISSTKNRFLLKS